MIMLQWREPKEIVDYYSLIQSAIDLEFSTLPPYLYTKFSILPGSNPAALARLDAIIGQEMIHMCLACNILNALGGTPAINPPPYPCHLPGDVDRSLEVHLLPFSPQAAQQGMNIEKPDKPIEPRLMLAEVDGPKTIGEFYHRLELALGKLPPSAWIAGRNQIGDAQFFAGQLFAVNNLKDAQAAINKIVSEGEGTPVSPDNPGSPLDFQKELAHYYRFWELDRNQVLTRDSAAPGYRWGEALGVDWTAVYPAIPDPSQHDFSKDPPAAQAAQQACNAAFAAMVDALSGAFSGATGGLGVAVRHMFDLRMAALQALQTPLADGKSVAGPAFIDPKQAGPCSKGASA